VALKQGSTVLAW